MKILEGTYKGIKFNYSPHDNNNEHIGILTIIHHNGIESTHIIKNWGLTRIFQYIESMHYLT